MAREVLERYRRWFEYEQMAHAKVLSSLNTVPTERRNTSAYLKAVALFAHIVAGRWLWLHRFGSAAAPPRPLFADNAGLEEVATQWRVRSGAVGGLLDSRERRRTRPGDRVPEPRCWSVPKPQ